MTPEPYYLLHTEFESELDLNPSSVTWNKILNFSESVIWNFIVLTLKF